MRSRGGRLQEVKNFESMTGKHLVFWKIGR